ncbi:30S ribosomal protein S17 [Patescibacteria group bacterium]|nr:30S ribosomal protein S17 [Patescibacteria group bacterium]
MSKKILEGKVISTKMQKTVVVAVEIPKRHKLYHKPLKNTKKFKVRDDLGVSLGAKVLIEECAPLSKTVTWIVLKDLDAEGTK